MRTVLNWVAAGVATVAVIVVPTTAAPARAAATCNGYAATIDFSGFPAPSGGAPYLITGTTGDDVIVGGLAASNHIDGMGGDDIICGGPMADAIFGNDGNDHLNGGAGDDHLYGGSGDDTLAGNQVFTPGAEDDQLFGGDGNDVLYPGGGDDTVHGGAVVSGASIDTSPWDMVSYANVTAGRVMVDLRITGPQRTQGAGQDTIVGVEHVRGTEFNDIVWGDAGANQLYGGNGDDFLAGGPAGNDSFYGEAGSDDVSFSGSTDGVTVDLSVTGAQSASPGRTIVVDQVEGLIGTDHDDILIGDDQPNELIGSAGDDQLYGAGGSDYFEGGVGDDFIDGEDGFEDTVYYLGNDEAGIGVNVSLAKTGPQDTVGEGVDTILGVESVIGSEYDDRLIAAPEGSVLLGGGGADILLGGAGADLLDGGPGRDIIDPGAGGASVWGRGGTDTVRFGRASGPVMVNLSVESAQDTGGASLVVLSSVENLIGTRGADTLIGDAGANRILGGRGNDLLKGGAGPDRLVGQIGKDRLVGGRGKDRCAGGPGRDRAAGCEIRRSIP